MNKWNYDGGGRREEEAEKRGRKKEIKRKHVRGFLIAFNIIAYSNVIFMRHENHVATSQW